MGPLNLRVVVAAVLRAAVGLALVLTSSMLLSGLLDLRGRLPEALDAPIGPSWLREGDGFEAAGDRTRRVTLAEQDGVMSVRWELVSDTEDPIAKGVAAGEVALEAEWFTSEVAAVRTYSVEAITRPDVSLRAGAPSVTSAPDEPSRVESQAARQLHADRVDVEVTATWCPDHACPVDVAVSAGTYTIAGLEALSPDEVGGIRPAQIDVQSRSPAAASFTLTSGSARVSLVRRGDATEITPQTVRIFDPTTLWPSWSGLPRLWIALCFTLPWFLLLLVPFPPGHGLRAKRYIGLALSGLLLALFVRHSQMAADALRWPVHQSVRFATGVQGFRISSGTPFAALLGVVWAGVALCLLAASQWTRVVVRLYLLAVLALGALVVAAAIPETRADPWLPADAATLLVLVVGLLGGLAGAWLLAYTIGRNAVRPMTQILVALAGLAAVGAMAALSRPPTSATAWGGGLATLLLNAVFVATLATVPVAAVVDRRRSTASGTVSAIARNLPWIWALLFLLAMWVAVPRERHYSALAPVDTLDVFPVAGATVDAAKVALFAALLAVLWALSHRGRLLERDTSRPLAWATGGAMLLRPDVLFGGVPIAFLVGLLLLRWALVDPSPEQGDDREAVHAVVAAGSRHRLVRDLRRKLDHKAASGETSLSEADDQLAVARRYARNSAGAGVIDVDPAWRARGFGSGHPDPWRRGLTGAAIAAIAGLPGFLPALVSLSRASDMQGAVPVLSASAAVIVVLRYPLYGFFFGYFLPWLRGDTGVRKAWSFSIALGVSEALVLLLPYQSDQDVLGAFVSWSAQILLISFALGVVFDALALRRAGVSVSALVDVHHTTRLGVFSSALAASVATALATTLASSAATLIASQIGAD